VLLPTCTRFPPSRPPVSHCRLLARKWKHVHTGDISSHRCWQVLADGGRTASHVDLRVGEQLVWAQPAQVVAAHIGLVVLACQLVLLRHRAECPQPLNHLDREGAREDGGAGICCVPNRYRRDGTCVFTHNVLESSPSLDAGESFCIGTRTLSPSRLMPMSASSWARIASTITVTCLRTSLWFSLHCPLSPDASLFITHVLEHAADVRWGRRTVQRCRCRRTC
jgi:hypothetical protein